MFCLFHAGRFPLSFLWIFFLDLNIAPVLSQSVSLETVLTEVVFIFVELFQTFSILDLSFTCWTDGLAVDSGILWSTEDSGVMSGWVGAGRCGSVLSTAGWTLTGQTRLNPNSKLLIGHLSP